ncbi:MAG: Fic family protein [Candidatus Marinimicrobia bacterium]|nr:Fic family protein [Candidatus Neomarinimicrobiota bacterium]
MNTTQQIKQILDKFRDNDIPFITVNNSEWYTLFRDEIRNSIAIEGIFANRTELLSVLNRSNRTQNQKSAAILGYFEAASSLYEYAENQYELNEFDVRLADLKQIHTILMRYESQFGTFTGKLGGFREEDVAVTQSTFTPLSYHYLPQILPIFIKWHHAHLVNPKFDDLTFFAASHVLFETIHPFRDGNGRVGRILLSYLLIGSGLINLSIKGTQKSDRDKYYHALEIGDNEIEKMLRKIEQGEKPTVSRINKAIDKSDLSELKTMIHYRLNHSLDLIEKDINTTDDEALIPLRDAAKFYSYSQDYLRQLIHQGRLPAQKRGKLWVVKIKDMVAYNKSMNKK